MRDYRYTKNLYLLAVCIVTNKNYPIHMFGKIKMSADKLHWVARQKVVRVDSVMVNCAAQGRGGKGL